MADITEDFEVFQTQRMLGLGQGYAIIAIRPLPNGLVHLEEYLFFPKLEDVDDYANQRTCSETHLFTIHESLRVKAQTTVDQEWKEHAVNQEEGPPGIKFTPVSSDILRQLWYNRQCTETLKTIFEKTTVSPLARKLHLPMSIIPEP